MKQKTFLTIIISLLLLSFLSNCADKTGLGEVTDEDKKLADAAESGDIEKAKEEIEEGANVNVKLENDWTPLHYAVANGDIDMVQFLISKGADVDSQARDGETPLHVASREGYIEIVQLLIDNGANVNAQTNDGVTPLLCASNDKIANLLMENGATKLVSEEETE